mgnify:CR=1 FL=1
MGGEDVDEAMINDLRLSGDADAIASADRAALSVQWDRVAAGLRQDLGARTFDHWLKHVKLGSLGADGVLHLSAPSVFTAQQIEARFLDRLLLAWRQLRGDVREVAVSAAVREGATSILIDTITQSAPQRAPVQVDARLTFARFVTGRSNILAANAARRMAAPEAPAFAPLYLRGDTGQGKTHLFHAIAAATIERDPAARVTMLSAEKFMVEFIAAMRSGDTLDFKARLRATDLLLIDDLQFVIGKQSTQAELLHTIDEVTGGGGRLVFAADRAPHLLDGIDARLASRLGGGLVADIDAPDEGLRLAILAAMNAERGAGVSEDVLGWLAATFPRNVRELEGALNKLIAYATLTGEAVTLDFARARLEDQARHAARRVSIEEIQKAVCAHYRLDRAEMASQRRTRAVARPRQVAMYLAKELTPRSFPEIGRRFGGRDHSTVIHAIRTIETLRAGDCDLDADIRRIRAGLVG